MSYTRRSHTLFHHRYHIVWIPKYRYKVLRGKIRERVREIIRQVCAEMDVQIIKGVFGAEVTSARPAGILPTRRSLNISKITTNPTRHDFQSHYEPTGLRPVVVQIILKMIYLHLFKMNRGG